MPEPSQLKLAVKTMIPFELSFIDIALVIAITVLIILYVTLLLRLKPSTKHTLETHTKKETHIHEETRPKKPGTTTVHQTIRQEVPEKPRTPIGTPRTSEKIVVSVENQTKPEQPTAPIEIEEMPRRPIQPLEAPKVEEEALSVEPPTLPSTKPAECPHYYGYLKKLPKNVPIPDECLGCLRIVECLHSSPISE